MSAFDRQGVGYFTGQRARTYCYVYAAVSSSRCGWVGGGDPPEAALGMSVGALSVPQVVPIRQGSEMV